MGPVDDRQARVNKIFKGLPQYGKPFEIVKITNYLSSELYIPNNIAIEI